MAEERRTKVKQAIALGYDPNEDNAPKVIASGKGILADKIIEKAKEENKQKGADQGRDSG